MGTALQADRPALQPVPRDDTPAPRVLARVLHVINGEHYAGAERVQDLLSQRLPARGYPVGLACVKPGRFAELRRSQDAPLYVTPMQSRFDIRPAWKLARIIARHGYRLVHTHTPRSVLVGRAAAALAGVPVVHHVHSPTARDSTRGWADHTNALVERTSLVGVSAVIGVSSAMGRYARQLGIPARLVHVVPNGVPVRGALPTRQLPEVPWTLGTVALFRPRKGLEVLLETVAVLRELGQPARLRAVGGFETTAYQTEVMATVERLGVADQIDWIGYAQDVTAELDQMDLFILPSLFGEGLPMVILEAMAASVPVIATAVEGVPEAIRDSQDGLLAKPGNAHELAMAVERVITGEVDWQALRASAHRRQAARFSDYSMAASVADVYRRVLKK